MAAHVIGTYGTPRSTGHRRGGRLLEWLERTAVKLAESLAWYRRYRTTLHELEGLSSRELDDIGIARCDIPTIAMQSANAGRKAV